MICQNISPVKLAAVCLPLLLVACGGDGGGVTGSTPDSNGAAPTVPVVPTNATSNVSKGRWIGSGATAGYVAISVPANAGAGGAPLDTLWVVLPDASTLHKLHVRGSTATAGTVTGAIFAAGSSAAMPISAASYVLQSAGGQQLLVRGLPNDITLGLSHSSEMATSVTVAQAQGNWQAIFDGAQVAWRVQEQSITGTSTTGCSYNGQLSPLSGIGIYRVQFVETCMQGEQRFNGIGSINTGLDRLTVLSTTDSDARAATLFFAKQ